MKQINIHVSSTGILCSVTKVSKLLEKFKFTINDHQTVLADDITYLDLIALHNHKFIIFDLPSCFISLPLLTPVLLHASIYLTFILLFCMAVRSYPIFQSLSGSFYLAPCLSDLLMLW